MPRANRCSAGPTVAPRMLATSASVSAASWPMVSMPSRFSFSSATGPMPHSLRTGNPPSSARSSARGTTRMPSGLASPEAILAICLPEPAPTEAIRPVSSRTLRRRSSQNASTSRADAPASCDGSPKPSSKDSCSITGTTARMVSKTRRLATPYTTPRGGSTTAVTPTCRRAWCIGMAERAPNTRAS
ncbi:Uncharacterised protein [Mycobacterium tuberculosis]|nr:Uncharacterised protein [Mycobacterium tuberculosis]